MNLTQQRRFTSNFHKINKMLFLKAEGQRWQLLVVNDVITIYRLHSLLLLALAMKNAMQFSSGMMAILELVWRTAMTPVDVACVQNVHLECSLVQHCLTAVSVIGEICSMW